MNAEDCVILGNAHLEPGGGHDTVVKALAVDVLDAGQALQQCLDRLGDKLHRVIGGQPVGLDEDIHHGHRDLRLFLARQHQQGHEPQNQSRNQQQRRQR